MKFGKSLSGVFYFSFQNIMTLIQVMFIYLCFPQKFGFYLFDVELSITLNGTFCFTFPDTVKPGK